MVHFGFTATEGTLNNINSFVGNTWNSKDCFDGDHTNISTLSILRQNTSKSPVEEFWDRRVLGITSGIDDLGGIQWELLGTLTMGWVIVYLIIWKGLHASGKVIHLFFNQNEQKCATFNLKFN